MEVKVGSRGWSVSVLAEEGVMMVFAGYKWGKEVEVNGEFDWVLIKRGGELFFFCGVGCGEIGPKRNGSGLGGLVDVCFGLKITQGSVWFY